MAQYFRETEKRLVLGLTGCLDFAPHIHGELELVYMLEGTCTACCEDRQYLLEPGMFFFAFPEQVHHYHNSTKNCKAILAIADIDSAKGKIPSENIYRGDDTAVPQLLQIASREHDPYIVHPLLVGTINMLQQRISFRSGESKNSSTAQIIKYCSAHYTEPLSVSSVANALYLSQSCISHTFNEKLKISFCDYVNSLRLDDAVRLLGDDLSIEQIAERAGFPTVRTFNRVFRKKYGTSPSQYRKSSL